MTPARQPGKSGTKPEVVQKIKAKHVQRLRRKRVMSLTQDERKQIVYLFDHSGGDADYVTQAVSFAVLQRADVLAVVLAETRRRGPSSGGSMGLFACAGAAA